MKIVKLQAENIMKLQAVEITPEGTLVRIGGKNGAGKTSVLDSIAMAMGGAELVPAEPIRHGESKASIVVDLGDFVVTRKFSREALPEVADRPQGWGPIKSTLTVKNKEGFSAPSPQAVLNHLFGRLTFDPLQFAHDDDKRQEETLRKLVGLDLREDLALHSQLYQERREVNRQLNTETTLLESMTLYGEVPDEEVSTTEVTKLLEAAGVARAEAQQAQNAVNVYVHEMTAVDRAIAENDAKVLKLQAELEAADKYALDLKAQAKLAATKKETAIKVLEAAQAKVPDTAAISKTIEDIEDTNNKIRANKARAAVERRAHALAEKAGTLTEQLTALGKSTEAKTKAVKYPIDGLGLGDKGVTYNGTPFKQASTAEQIRVSVAIGLALNPKLKVLLVRNGNSLDKTSLQAIAKQAQDADAQVWMEWVAETQEGVEVLLEDGSVAQS